MVPNCKVDFVIWLEFHLFSQKQTSGRPMANHPALNHAFQQSKQRVYPKNRRIQTDGLCFFVRVRPKVLHHKTTKRRTCPENKQEQRRPMGETFGLGLWFHQVRANYGAIEVEPNKVRAFCLPEPSKFP